MTNFKKGDLVRGSSYLGLVMEHEPQREIRILWFPNDGEPVYDSYASGGLYKIVMKKIRHFP